MYFFNFYTIFFFAISTSFLVNAQSVTNYSDATPHAHSESTVDFRLSRKDTTSFEALFSHVQSISIRGTSENPIFQFSDLAVRDSLIAVLDQGSATITVFNRKGDLLYQTGRPGRGPGELTNPSWIGFDSQGRIVVLEGLANHRIQLFSPENGRSIKVISEDVLVAPNSDDAYIESRPNDQHIIFATEVPCAENPRSRCLVQEHSLSSGKMVRRFATQEEVEPEARSIPWILGRGAGGRSYVAHNSGSHIAVYEPDGTFLRRVDLGQSPVYYPLHHASVPKNIDKAFETLQNRKYSKIRHISVIDETIIVNHLYKNGVDNPHFISISEDGKHIISTSELDDKNKKVYKSNNNRFLFVETDKSSDFGLYSIHEYRYRGPNR